MHNSARYKNWIINKFINERNQRCFEIKYIFAIRNHNRNYISNKLRELARLILSIRRITGTKVNLEYCITPCNREELLEGVRDVAGYDASIHKYAIPSLALKLGGSLFKCAKLLQATALIKSNDEKIKKAQEKEPEAAKEYAIHQLFYQLIEDGYSQSANNDHDRACPFCPHNHQRQYAARVCPLVCCCHEDCNLATDYMWSVKESQAT